MHWVKLPSGRYLNLAHVADAEYDEQGTKPRVTLRLGVPDYSRDPDNTGGTDLLRVRLYGEDATMLRAWLDVQATDIGR